MNHERASAPRCRQCAALPIERRGAEVRVLLVTSRETRRWVLPKGWLERNVSAADQAAREAFEEAGIRGRVAKTSLGTYTYAKRLPDGAERDCEVEVYPLEVERLLHAWPEEAERERRWFSIAEAAEAVQEAGLGQLLRQMASSTAA